MKTKLMIAEISNYTCPLGLVLQLEIFNLEGNVQLLAGLWRNRVAVARLGTAPAADTCLDVCTPDAHVGEILPVGFKKCFWPPRARSCFGVPLDT
jgi:hypothetical protein